MVSKKQEEHHSSQRDNKWEFWKSGKCVICWVPKVVGVA